MNPIPRFDKRVYAIQTIIGLSSDRDLLRPLVDGEMISYDTGGGEERALVSQFLLASDELRVIPINSNGATVTIDYTDVTLWY